MSKKFGSRDILSNVSLSVESGSMSAITGPSGSGKSTLLNCVGLLEKPDTGTIRIDGTDTTNLSKRQRLQFFRYSLGYLFQNYALVDSESVDYNLDIATRYVPHQRTSQLKRQALDFVGLDSIYTRQKIYELSGGEQQRVALARLVLKRPSVILADEPTGALDADNRSIVLDALQKMSGNGATVLIATHDDTVIESTTSYFSLMDPRLDSHAGAG
ncbi:ATP-binding cassette domain-containing protein [Rhodococcus erythropolis]|uniref:ATP-binding cassette domain-containing protein n=1 Tax=Rhodococcus erythropolis TaxID=1833 RepID=UPI00294994D0|nr:ATP-binding cassette domain-containing protein [Rhodococcus erythropolis]MDV6278385.1 ATP-binding cassette domain-containing protein [Rhodococcus erythropolis]